MIHSNLVLTQDDIDKAPSIEPVIIKRKATLLMSSTHVTEKVTCTSLEHLNYEGDNRLHDFIKNSIEGDIKAIKGVLLNGSVSQVVVVTPREFSLITGNPEAEGEFYTFI